MAEPNSPAAWIQYYSRKRILHQWTQVHLISTVPCRRILEIGPALGLVTALLANAGYEVETLDQGPKPFAEPNVRHLERDLLEVRGCDIAGYDAILCCETLEHLDWQAVGPVLAELHASGAKYLLVSVPYMAPQLTVDFYANGHTLRHYFSLKKRLGRREFAREPPGGHQWEVGYKGFALPVWEARLRDSGWQTLRREFTEHTRSVFHLLEAA